MVKTITIAIMVVICLQCMQAQEVGPKVTQFDWSQFEFTYTDDSNVEHFSKLTDEAKTTDHIIALLRAVYINENVPGIRYAYAYRHPGEPMASLHRQLNYGFNYTAHDTRYEGSYTNHGNAHGRGGGGVNNTWDRSMDSDILPIKNPVEDGMTVMLVQLNESWTMPTGAGDKDHASNIIDSAYSSVQIVKAFTRVHDENNPGYLFAIDGTATNKFFFISKGKPRASSSRPLYRLYEQISPVKGDHGSTTYDFISKMKSGQVYYCFHDCYDVATYAKDKDSHGNSVGHWFTISNEGEAYSLKNLCLYVPDRRFENELRDEDPVMDGLSWYDDQANYYTNYGVKNGSTEMDSIIRPKVLMYTADLNAEAVPSEVENHYRVNLDWSTSFTDQKIGAHVPEHFYVYIVKEDGSWVRIDDLLGENEPVERHEGSYLVEQTYETQTFNYVITAHPINYDMDGNMIMDGMDTLNTELEKPLVTITAVSPVRTVIIPPLGKPFFQKLYEYRSFYNVNSEENFYRNAIAVKAANERAFLAIKDFKGYYDVTRTDPDSNKVTIAHVSITQEPDEVGFWYHVDYEASTQQDITNNLFDTDVFTDGFIATANDEMVFFDHFRASTAQNEHYDHYIYNFEQVEVDGNGAAAFQEACSNPVTVPVFKTTNTVETEGYTREAVLDDRDHHLEPRPVNSITFTAIYDPAANLVEYDVLRVNKQHHPVDEYKVGKAENFNNSGEYHVITVGSEGYLNNLEQIKYINYGDASESITVLDKYGAIANKMSSYVPTIITLFGGNQSKVNTYGCNIQDMSYPQLSLEISAEKSESFKQKDDDGNIINSKGYTSMLHLTPVLTDEMKYAYYYRVWRVVDGEETEVLLNELEDFSGTGTNSNTGATAAWQAIYSTIQETYPGENPMDVCDIIVRPFNDDDDDDFEVTYIARLYATYIDGYNPDVITPDRPGRRVAEHGGKDYVVVEQKATVNFKGVPTYVKELNQDQVVSVTYFNLQGIPSNRPYQGMNIVVTRYANGKTVTEKMAH